MKGANVAQRLAVLARVDFTQCEASSIESQKTAAFQLVISPTLALKAQTVALLRGVQIYTKSAAKEMFPALVPFLSRQPGGDLSALNLLKDELVAACKDVRISQHGPLVHFSFVADRPPQNTLEVLSRGVVVHVTMESTLTLPLTHSSDLSPEFPLDPPNNLAESLLSPIMHEGAVLWTDPTGFREDIRLGMPADVTEDYFYMFRQTGEDLQPVARRRCSDLLLELL